MRGPATTIMRNPGTRSLACGKGRDDAPEEVSANARASHGDDADALVVVVSELGAQLARSPRSAGSNPVT